jgi:hypothetical protein
MMQPSFHRRILGQLAGIIARANDACLARWEAKCDAGEPVNVTNDMSEMTLEIILRMIFGDDIEAMAAEAGENPFAVLTGESERDLRFAYRFRKLTSLIGRCVARRRAAGSEPTGADPEYLSMLLQARDKDSGEGMTDKEIAARLNLSPETVGTYWRRILSKRCTASKAAKTSPTSAILVWPQASPSPQCLVSPHAAPMKSPCAAWRKAFTCATVATPFSWRRLSSSKSQKSTV